MTAPEHRSYAGVVSRFGGLAIDVLLLALAVTVFGRGVPDAWKLVARLPRWLEMAFALIADVTPAVYFTLCWRLTGQTLGSWAFGTRVTLEDGRRLGDVRAALRAILSVVLAPVWLLGTVTVLFDTRRRSLLDIVFGTVVSYIRRSRR